MSYIIIGECYGRPRRTPKMFVKSLCALALVSLTSGQLVPPNSFPHVWPGQPKGGFSPEWQNCERLPRHYSYAIIPNSSLDQTSK